LNAGSPSVRASRGARAARLALPVAALPLLLVAAHGAKTRLESAAPRRADPAELTLFPTGRWVRPAALGRARLAADLAWCEAIQYYGKHRRSDRAYPYAETLFRTLTDLDPSFEGAYVFGALVLHSDVGRPDAAYALLQKGIARNPQSWRLLFEYGFHRYLESKESEEACRYLSRAAALPGAPDWIARLAAYAARASGRRELSLELWRQVLRRSENPEVRRIARRYLRELGAPEAAEFPSEDA
jgi:tetratricopeptide (TPR) repeat protein